MARGVRGARLYGVGGEGGSVRLGMNSQYVKQLRDSRFILAGWIPRAGLFYAFPFRHPPVDALTLEGLVAEGVPTYATRAEAEAAARQNFK